MHAPALTAAPAAFDVTVVLSTLLRACTWSWLRTAASASGLTSMI